MGGRPVFGATQEELQRIIGQLEQAVHSHDEWFESVNRIMLCRLPYDQRDVRNDAHRECRFGQWLYQLANDKLREHPAFSAIEKEHRCMHTDASRLLLDLEEYGTIPADSYDRFANSLKRLRLEINTLKKELQDTLYNLDSLTGANSRIGMLTHLREQRELVRRNTQVYSIAMLDLDHFKLINDQFGHQIGDQVLRTVTRFILDSIRPYDRIFRYGGEEFLISMPQTDSESAAQMAERLRLGIAGLQHNYGGTPLPPVTVSFGVAGFEPELNVEDVIEHADQALYAAKHAGRNHTRQWSLAMEQEGIDA